MKKTETYIKLRNRASLIIAAAIALSIVLALYGRALYQHMAEAEDTWDTYTTHAIGVTTNLAKFKSEFGYGGFIHHFKNLLIRKDRRLIPIIEARLAAAYKALDALEAEEKATELEPEFIQLRQVVDNYAQNFRIAIKLLEEGKSTQDIDNVVRVDDTPAYAAIAKISAHIKEHSQAIRDDTHAQMQRTASLLLNGLILIPLIFIIAYLLIVFLKRLIRSYDILNIVREYSETIIQAVPDGLFIVDQNGHICDCNLAAQQLLGYTRSELQALPVEALMPERYRQGHVSLRNNAVTKSNIRPINMGLELFALHKNGEEIPVEIGLSFSHQEDGIVSIVSMRNVKERRRAEEGLRLARNVFDNSLEAIVIMDRQGEIVDLNEAFCDLCGYSRNELLHATPSMLSIDRDDADSKPGIWSVITANDSWQGEIWCRHKNGELSPCLASISQVKDRKGVIQQYVGIFFNITTLKAHQQQLEFLAHFDQLTGLANRFLLHDRLQSAVLRAQRNQEHLAVLYLDLDGFKQVNDRLGHKAGDELLISVAQTMQETLRESDTIARLGGDEFAILLHQQADRHTIEQAASRLLQKLDRPIDAGNGETLPVSASIGISIYPADDTSPEGLLKKADQAMYQAKHQGKNRYCFFDTT